MIYIPDLGINATATAHLSTKQTATDGEADYTRRTHKAQRDWNGAKKKNAAFTEIKKQLTEMCHGPNRCGYCEDSEANQIEHIKPKSLYPETTFSWPNYLYVCGGCNQPKLNHYAVFRHGDRQRVDHMHPRPTKANPNPTRIPPPDGDPLFINPRVDYPLQLLELNLKTFMFIESDDNPQSEDFQKKEGSSPISRARLPEINSPKLSW
jgi:uncharacterized protein (TIGR02646 family)